MQFTKIRLSGRTDVDLPIIGLRPSNQYKLKTVDGLGPPEIDVFLTKGVYSGRQPQDKQVVIRIGLNPNVAVGQTVAAMRNTLYGLLTPGANDLITLKLMNGPGVVAQVDGYVTKIEIVPFVKDPEVQITIDCTSPYLSAAAPVTLVPSAKTAFTVDNTGSVTTGFYIEVIFNASLANWSLFSGGSGVAPKMRVNYAFIDGDKLMIDTRKGQKSVKVLRSSTTTNLIGKLSSDSTWAQLHPGVNTLWTSSQNFDWGQVIFTPKYWGV